MVALSGGTLLSDCHRSVIYLGDQDEYRCSRCMQSCSSAGTIGELWHDDNPAATFKEDDK